MQKLLSILMLLTCSIVTSQNLNVHSLIVEKSVINWKGTYSFLFSEHTGTVQFKEGKLYTANRNITGGDFIIDMTTISNEDYLNNRGAVEHLRNPDFFDVEQFPKAKLVITHIEYFYPNNEHIIDADLTIKGITKPIEFRATVDEPNKQMRARLKIDRTRWGIIYNHKIKNQAISDAIEFDVLLQF